MGELRPALTAQEWATRSHRCHACNVRLQVESGHGLLVGSFGDDGRLVWREHLQAIAALALDSQPFGFTWEDVDRIRHAADVVLNEDAFGSADHEAAAAFHSIADRIAALLPPREP